MAEPFSASEGQPDSKRIDEFLRLAASAPDEDLLRRFFTACAGIEPATGDPLTTAQRRWVTTNLAANPVWQESWRRLEEEFGRAVAWPPAPPPPAAGVRDRPPSRGLLSGRGLGRHLVTGLLGLVLLYGVLWTVGRLSVPDTYTLAAVTDYKNALRTSARSADVEAASDFSTGAVALLAAPRTTLGLFPHYDRAQTERARTHLRRAFNQTSDPFQRAEIAFFLAKAALMQDDRPAARTWLEQVRIQNVADYRDEAAALLQQLDTLGER